MEVEKQIREIIEFYCGGTYENRAAATQKILQICQNLQLQQTGVMVELPDYELAFCDKCFQMTNHLNGKCQKCKGN
jgi:multimeric flavodoxin WrbA